MDGVKIVAKNLDQWSQGVLKADQNRKKAGKTAMQVEGFRLRKELKAELLSSRPGGVKLKPLTQIARRTKTGKFRKHARKPLAPLARKIRYRINRENRMSDRRASMEIGFTGGKMDTRSWKELVLAHQEGAPSIVYSGSREELGIRMARIGARLLKRGDPDAKFFFLRKHGHLGFKRRYALPARPIIDPFWNAHKNEASKNIQHNFERKMRGERI